MRWVRAAVLTLLLTAACVSVQGGSDRSAAARRAGAEVGECKTPHLELNFVDRDSDSLMGNRKWYFAFVNRSLTSCRLNGYPSATLYADGKPLTDGQENGGWYVLNSDPPSTVVVEPGDHAYFALVNRRCDPENPDIGSSTTIAARPPGDSQTAEVSVTGIHVCSDRRVGVSAIRSSKRDV